MITEEDAELEAFIAERFPDIMRLNESDTLFHATVLDQKVYVAGWWRDSKVVTIADYAQVDDPELKRKQREIIARCKEICMRCRIKIVGDERGEFGLEELTDYRTIYDNYFAEGGSADLATFKTMLARFYGLTLEAYVYGNGNRRRAYIRWERYCREIGRPDDAERVFDAVDLFSTYS